MKKKSKPQDATMRNVRAAGKRIRFLEHRIDTLCAALNDYREKLEKVWDFVFDPTGAYLCRDDLERAIKEAKKKAGRGK